jgi:hypothetical protein
LTDAKRSTQVGCIRLGCSAHAAISMQSQGALPQLAASANHFKVLPQSTNRERLLAFTPHYDNHPTSAIFMPRWRLKAGG